ncbi:MAG: glycosyltransferase [Anaerolineales bacterium]|nr:glycosyltransferase [Anaerolineales bacterium]
MTNLNLFRWSWRRAAALSFLAVPLSLQAERAYRNLPNLTHLAACQTGAVAPLPAVSIIVPARNEEKNLPKLLPSLQRLRYPGPVEIIVVDDNSTDRTAEVTANLGVRVISAGALPPGWLGKPNACHAGARVATGEWLLFTDADTVHQPDGPAEAVQYCLDHRLDGLSLFLRQEMRGISDRLALMVAFAGLYAGIGKGNGMLNGQYILLQRRVYFASGGFAAVHGEPLEDLALGHALRKAGFRTPLLHGDSAGQVQMYENTPQIWRGLTRLSAGTLRWSGFRAVITALYVSAVMSPVLASLGVAVGGLDRKWLPATWLAVILSMAPWGRRFGSAAWALLTPIAAVFVQAAGVWGLVRRLLGFGFSWKGRTV